MDILEVIDKVGLPTGIVVIMIWACRAAAKFLSPLVTAFFNGHVETMETMKEHSKITSECLSELKDVSRDTNEKVHDVHGHILKRDTK